MVFLYVLLQGRRCYFARGGKVTKTPPGDGFVSTFAQRVLTVTHPTPSGHSGHLPLIGGVGPRTPVYGGAWYGNLVEMYRRGVASDVLSFSRPLPLCGKT